MFALYNNQQGADKYVDYDNLLGTIIRDEKSCHERSIKI